MEELFCFVFLSVEIRPENEYDKLLRLSNEYYEDTSSDIRPCGGFSLRYECACDFYQVQCHRYVQNVSFFDCSVKWERYWLERARKL